MSGLFLEKTKLWVDCRLLFCGNLPQNIMSHLVSVPGNNYLSSDCILRIPCTEIVTSKFRKRVRYTHKDMQGLNNREEEMIIRMCKNLSSRELSNIEKENHTAINRQFAKLKKKMAASSRSKEQTVAKFFEGKSPCEPRLSTLLKTHPTKIDIMRKYQMKISHKISSIQEARNIQESKDKYNLWLDNCNNSPIKSPNYTKMNYVIQRVSRSNQLSDIIQPYHNTFAAGKSYNKLPVSLVDSRSYSPSFKVGNHSAATSLKQSRCDLA